MFETLNPSLQIDEIFGRVVSEFDNMQISYNDPLVNTISKEIELLLKSNGLEIKE